jgi:hypothetical protein
MNLFVYAALLQATPAQSAWELAKGVMLTLTTAGVMGMLHLTLRMRDDVRDLKRDVGELALDSRDHGERLQILESWKTAEDAVTAIEKEMLRNSDRYPERLRDKLHPDLGT